MMHLCSADEIDAPFVASQSNCCYRFKLYLYPVLNVFCAFSKRFCVLTVFTLAELFTANRSIVNAEIKKPI